MSFKCFPNLQTIQTLAICHIPKVSFFQRIGKIIKEVPRPASLNKNWRFETNLMLCHQVTVNLSWASATKEVLKQSGARPYTVSKDPTTYTGQSVRTVGSPEAWIGSTSLFLYYSCPFSFCCPSLSWSVPMKLCASPQTWLILWA